MTPANQLTVAQSRALLAATVKKAGSAPILAKSSPFAALMPAKTPTASPKAAKRKGNAPKQVIAAARRDADLAWLASQTYVECVAEHRFHHARKWRFDFAWPSRKVALEVDGGLFRSGGGAHRSVSGILRDIEKGNTATALGWRIIRCQPKHLRTLETVQLLSACFAAQAKIHIT